MAGVHADSGNVWYTICMKPYVAAGGYAFSGCISVIAQTLLLREAMGVFQGNELSLGIVLACWLTGIAAGSRLGSAMRRSIAPGTSIRVPLIASAILLPLMLAAFRFARPVLETVPGMEVSLGTLALTASALVIPFSILFGFQAGAAPRVSRAWMYEAAGAGAGGVIFTCLLLPLDNPFLAALTVCAATVLFIVVTVPVFGGRYTLRTVFAGIAGLAGVGLLISQATVLDRGTLAQGSFRGYTICASHHAPYGQSVVAERAGERAVFSNGLLWASYPDNAAVQSESFAYLPYLFHQNPRNALVIGSMSPVPAYLRGLVDEIVSVEHDAVLAAALPSSGPAVIGDGRTLLARTRGRYDLVYVNVPYPTTLALNRMYTAEFFTVARAALSDTGILAFRAPGSLVHSDRIMTDLSYTLLITAGDVFDYVRLIPGDDNLFIASPRRLPPPGIVRQRLARLGGRPAFLSRAYLRHMLNPERSLWLSSQFAAVKADRAMNHDLMPRGMMRGMLYGQSIRAPRFAQAHETATTYAWVVLLLILVWLMTDWIGPAGTAFASGAASMGLYMAVMWSIQTAYGNIYHWIGLTTACFMTGAALGTAWTHSGRFPVRVLGTETLWVLWTAGAYALVTRAGVAPVAGYIAFAGATGVLLGVQFPQLARRAGAAAYTADALGAAMAALVCGAVLIPTWGVANTLLVIIALKLATLQWWLTR